MSIKKKTFYCVQDGREHMNSAARVTDVKMNFSPSSTGGLTHNWSNI